MKLIDNRMFSVYSNCALILTIISLNNLQTFANGECVRPAGILQVEETCYETSHGILEKAHKTVHDLLNRASKALGIGNGAEALATASEEPMKCIFYQCIFKKLMLTNQYDLPDIESIRTLFDKTSGFSEKDYNKLDECATELKDKLAPPTLDSRVVENLICDVSKDLMKCISANDECPAFKFP